MAKKKQMDRLSRDAAAAKAAGMSYGKWKALHPHDPEPAPKPKKKTRKVCALCGKIFYQSDNRRRKYCSPECQYEANLASMKRQGAKWRAAHRGYNRRKENAMPKEKEK